MNSALYGLQTSGSGRTREVTRGGKHMWDIVYYLSIVLFLAVAMIGGAFAVRAYMGGTGPMQAVGALFGPKPERRLSITEQYNIDNRRRLVLIRRDDVEHLSMTGGPVDLVIETGIGAPHDPRADSAASGATVSSRAPGRG